MQEWEIVCKAPAKVIIAGEYLVLFGNTGIISSVDKWVTVKLSPSTQLSVNLKDLGLHQSISLAEVEEALKDESSFPKAFEARSFKLIWIMMKGALKGKDLRNWLISISVESTVPIGKGLGSSGAFSVALAMALYQYANHSVNDLRAIKALAMESETFVHGKTSGIDVEVSLFGGIRFHKNGVSTRMDYDPLRDYDVYLVDSGVARESKQHIADARAAFEAMPEASRQKQLNDLEDLLQGCLRDSVVCLSTIEALHHFLVNELHVYHPVIGAYKTVINNETMGEAVSTKFTGAGGGGFLLSLFLKSRTVDPHERLLKMRRFLKESPLTAQFNVTVELLSLADQGAHIVRDTRQNSSA